MMTQTANRALALTSFLSLFGLPAGAQVALNALSLTANAHYSATSWQERNYRPAGIVEVVHVQGHVLLDVRAVFDGPWSDTVDRISVTARNIRLVLPDGTELEPRGSYQYWGQLDLTTRSLSGRRPRDFPTSDADIPWNGLFVVPESVSSATLRIATDEVTFEGAVSIPKASTPEDAASFASFRPTTVRRFRTALLQDGTGATAVTSTISAPPGQVLAEIAVEVTGLASNNADGSDSFNWHTYDFRLVTDDGTTLGSVGERFLQRILDYQFNGTNTGRSAERRMLWVVPEGLAEARLLFGETEVARVALGTAAITDTD